MLAIPDKEFKERIRRFQANIGAAGLDAALVHSNEADSANVRYLSDYWPAFETAGIFVPARGQPVLIIGPESEAYARQRSKIRRIAKMTEYRESAEPDYPTIKVAAFPDIVRTAMGAHSLKTLGLVGFSILPVPIYRRLQRELKGVKLVKADDTLVNMRIIKSPNEIALMRKAFKISEIAIDAVLGEIRPGMTELQVIGIAQREIYTHGGEYEGHVLYCFCGPKTCNAISRPTHNRIKKNTMIQLNIGARVGGYSSSVGVPFVIGRLPQGRKRLWAFGLEAHLKTIDLIRAGKPAADVVREYEEFVKGCGFARYMLYGPCHGLGMMEVERPWMESSSTYDLQENMTFQVDTFFYDRDFGLRWENGILVRKGGAARLSSKFMKLIEL